jgi:hypothetical protein
MLSPSNFCSAGVDVETDESNVWAFRWSQHPVQTPTILTFRIAQMTFRRSHFRANADESAQRYSFRWRLVVRTLLRGLILQSG